jgi:hypothetical protein
MIKKSALFVVLASSVLPTCGMELPAQAHSVTRKCHSEPRRHTQSHAHIGHKHSFSFLENVENVGRNVGKIIDFVPRTIAGLPFLVTDTDHKSPASVRNQNPGAIWPGPRAAKFGAIGYEQLHDKARNKIAVFPDMVTGTAAQFSLLAEQFVGKTLREAIDVWSGHTGGRKQVNAYTAAVAEAIDGSPDTVITKEMLKGPKGRAFVRAMAKIESGREIDLAEEELSKAQQIALGDSDDSVSSD